ncbi:MAG: ATP-dependent helicase, partial [Pseudomonadota bacterium]
IAGRTLADRDQRLSIMAVGDDDQNIYQFRGANVAFIRRFREDYQARVSYLVDNYRSSGHIIAASNALIAGNRDRMKREHPIHLNPERQGLVPGGKWEKLDPLARGRVQVLQLADQNQQALALICELKRLTQLESGMQWSDCAVFVREWSVLEPIRALCEAEGIPVCMLAEKEKQPWPLRVRENRRLLEQLISMGEELRQADQLLELLDVLSTASGENAWWAQLRHILQDWREETHNSELPVKRSIEFVCESLIEQRRERQLSDGVFLSTIHSAKGMEFSHVFVPEGGWGRADNQQVKEAERRLYYVAMTRARETLCLFQLAQGKTGFAANMDGDYLLRREGVVDGDIPTEALGRRYTVLGMQDINLGYAGRKGAHDPIHAVLSQLEVGDSLDAKLSGGKILLMRGNLPVASLSNSAGEVWRERLERLESIRVLAMVRRTAQDEEEVFRRSCWVAEWEVPLVEIISIEAG